MATFLVLRGKKNVQKTIIGAMKVIQ